MYIYHTNPLNNGLSLIRYINPCMSVDDINLALSMNGFEEIYGLLPSTTTGGERGFELKPSSGSTSTSSR